MENKKMSCWDFVFSSVKTHIDDLVRQVEKPLNFDPFGHARFAHLFVLYD